MNKILVVLVILVFLFSAASAVASENEEITFLGLRLGESTPEEGIEALLNAGHLRADLNFKEDAYLFTPFEYSFDNEDSRFALGASDMAGYVVKSDTPVSIAGHVTSSTELQFIYSLENNTIIKENPKLVRGEYIFYPEEPKQVFDDLAAKLSMKYNNPKSYMSSFKYENQLRITEMKVWDRPNNTAAILEVEWFSQDGINPINTDYVLLVELRYAKTDVFAQLEQISEHYKDLKLEAETKQIEENLNNTDGL